MPPKRASGLTSSKKRPHEAPTKGRKVFAGSRQKVQRGGGGGGSRGRGADDEGADDPEGDDDMMEDAMDDDDGDGRARRAEGRGRGREEEESEEEIEETADEKRLRLAKSYLDKLRAEEAEAGGDSDEDDEDEEDARNMDSHDRLANRLKNEAMHKSGRVRREIARRVVAPTFGDEDEASEDDDDDDRAGTVWRGHRLSVTGLALTADDATAYSVSKEGGIVRWDVETGARTKFPRAPPAVVDPTKGGGGPMAPPRCGAAALLCCAVAQERHLLCTAGADKRIHVWDTRSMKHVQELASHRGAVTSLAIRDGTGQLFSGSADRTLKVWSLDDMAYVDTLFGHQSEVMCVAPQRRERVVTVGRDRTCRFWKVAEDSQLIFRPAPGAGQLESCAFVTPDTWVTGSDDGTVSLWSTYQETRGDVVGGRARLRGGCVDEPKPNGRKRTERRRGKRKVGARRRRAKVFRAARSLRRRRAPRRRAGDVRRWIRVRERSRGRQQRGSLGERRGGGQRHGSVRVGRGRRRDSAVAFKRGSGKTTRAPGLFARARVRQRARRGVERAVRAGRDGPGAQRRQVGQGRARQERTAHAPPETLRGLMSGTTQ
jgi:ribosomal RNA-processing protein 9